MDELSRTLAPLAEYLEANNIEYYVGGSVASSLLGVSRTTLDIDIEADIAGINVKDFVNTLGKDYYISEVALRDAIRTRASFNLVHLKTIIKIDVFVMKNEAFFRQIMARKVRDTLSSEIGAPEFDFSSSEDIILNKLLWFELSGRTSSRQLDDIRGVIMIHKKHLDFAYLRNWADRLKVLEVLDRLLDECTAPQKSSFN